MQFEQGHLYHLYNQGNNRRKIFFDRENYLFFLRKIQRHVIPFADILAWCLMPNHFHLMVHINHIEVDEQLVIIPGGTIIPSATTSRHRNSPTRNMSFNKSIGIMLASYTRAINKQQDWSGSLFRSETKAVCLTEIKGISPECFINMGITQFVKSDPDLEYPNTCFNYILNNPVKDRLVNRRDEWEFSSYSELMGIGERRLINKSRIDEFGLRLL
jgi:putative transposase